MMYLTPRQKEVIQLVARGMTTNEIAKKLYLSKDTVKSHRVRITRALDAKNMCEAIAIACRYGIA